MLEIERQAQRQRFAQSQEQLTLRERAARGLVELDLEAMDERVGLGGRLLVDYQRADRAELSMRLSPGDLVELRPRKVEGEAREVAVVTRARPAQVQLGFERAPAQWATDGRVQLELLPNEVTFDRARAAIARIAAMDKGILRRRREVLLGNEPPRFGRPPAFTPSTQLNPEQQDAVERALAAENLFLVHGPPGTGKSTVLGEVAEQSVRAGLTLLCTAASNAAVDHLLELCLGRGLRAVRVGHPARVLERLQGHTLDLLVEDHSDRRIARDLFDEAFELFGYARKQRSQGRSRERFANAHQSKLEARRLIDEARALERKAVDAVLGGAQVICATLSSLDTPVLARREFDLVLLDEATQAIEPLALGAFTRAPRVILAGDHLQLPPTVISLEAARRGLSRSLFERLLEDHGPQVKQLLREQYRMNEQIMRFPSEQTYGGQLRAHTSVASHTLADLLRSAEGLDAPPVLFLDTAGKGYDDEVEPESQSTFNPGEVGLVAARVRELLERGLRPEDLAVIAPYSAQVSRLRAALSPLGPGIEVDTVDAFQGREKEAILLSLTRSNPDGALGFLEDLRRINVALTRARRHLFIVGDSGTLCGHPYYARLVESVQARGNYRSAWEWPGG